MRIDGHSWDIIKINTQPLSAVYSMERSWILTIDNKHYITSAIHACAEIV
jgi:hypothetical protein